MVKDQQVRRLVKLKKNQKTLTMAAAKAGMSRKTARKYLKSGKRASVSRNGIGELDRIRSSRLAGGERDPEAICRRWKQKRCSIFVSSAGRGLPARPVENAAAQVLEGYGEAKEVMFPQKYQPGLQAQSDLHVSGAPRSDDPGPAVSPSAVPLRVGPALELGSDHAVFQ